MKRWLSKVVNDYFTFTIKERVGISLLLIIGLLFYLLPHFTRPKTAPIDKNAFLSELSQLKITVDSSRQYRSYKKFDEDDEYDYSRPQYYANEKKATGELFNFDPNTLDEAGWKRLGLRDKTIQTIQKFVSKGYRFKQPEDIKRIYGLHADEAARLIPLIEIAERDVHESNSYHAATNIASIRRENISENVFIDVNTADTTDFIALPGIGSKLAARIINFRDKLGGFASVEQLGETYGLPDSTFKKIQGRLNCDQHAVKAFDINGCDVNQLKSHPYIKWNIANAIVNYRQQHGRFTSLEDLKKINIITDELFKKISPYLKVL